MTPIFRAEQFTAMQTFYTAEDKAKLANDFVRFVSRGFRRTMFTKSLYQHLSNMWGHIAHYNQEGFYDTWFADDARRLSFLQACVERSVVGSPEFTRSDVEHELRRWVRESNLMGELHEKLIDDQEARECAELQRLAAKYPEVEAKHTG